MVFYAQGGCRDVQGLKGAVQGSQMDPLDGPIAGLVEGDTFFQTPLFRGVRSPVAMRSNVHTSARVECICAVLREHLDLEPLDLESS